MAQDISDLAEEIGDRFTTRTVRPLDDGNVRRAFKQLVRATGLPPATRLHDLQHAMATAGLAQGVPVKMVAERRRHASTAITLQLDGHVLPNMQPEAAEQMDAWLLEGSYPSPRRHQEPSSKGSWGLRLRRLDS